MRRPRGGGPVRAGVEEGPLRRGVMRGPPRAAVPVSVSVVVFVSVFVSVSVRVVFSPRVLLRLAFPSLAGFSLAFFRLVRLPRFLLVAGELRGECVVDLNILVPLPGAHGRGQTGAGAA